MGAAAPIWEVSSVLDRECWLNGKDNGCPLVGNVIGFLAIIFDKITFVVRDVPTVSNRHGRTAWIFFNQLLR